MGSVLTFPRYSTLDYKDCTILENPEKKRIGAAEYWWRSLISSDYKSAISVACISLPLSSALAIASGATPSMGLTAAMYGPIIQGVFGGSEYNILGPAGALVNILQSLAVNHGEHIIPYVTILAAILAFFCSIFRVAEFCMRIKDESAVLEGFSFAVAVTIGLGQLNNVFGLEGLKRKAMFHQNFGSSMRALFTNDPGTEKICAWYDNDDVAGAQEWRCESGFQWAEFVAFFVAFTLLCELAQNTGKGIVLGTTWGAKLNKNGRDRKPWLFALALLGIAIGGIFEHFVNDGLDIDGRKGTNGNVGATAFPLLLKHKYPAMTTMEPGTIMVNTEYMNHNSFTWSMSSTATHLSIWAIIIGAVEVAFVAVLETIVSAILGQQKKCRFTGRTEEATTSDDMSQVAPLEDELEKGTMNKKMEDVDLEETNASSGFESTALESNTATPTDSITSSQVDKIETKELTAPSLAPIPPFLPTNEVFGLSLANFVSGMCGGLPCTGVLLRTEVNAETGAESKASQWFNGMIVLVVSVALLKYFAYMPFFIIAAMLARSAIGLGQGAYRCFYNELIPALDKEGGNFKSKTERIVAYFDIFNFFAVFLVCLFLDGALGLSIGFIGKYVCNKYCQKFVTEKASGWVTKTATVRI